MDVFRVREARGGDRGAIGAMWTDLMRHHRALDAQFTIAPDAEAKYVRHAQEMIRTANARVLVADTGPDSALIAYIMGEIQNRPPLAMHGVYGFVSDVYVSAEWRGKGVGRALYADLRRWFVARKAAAVELYVAETNPAALLFWSEMGLSPFLKLLHEDL